MIVSDAQRPKSSQRGAINTWYLKVRENIDLFNIKTHKTQSNIMPYNQSQYMIQENQNFNMIEQSQIQSRNSSQTRQNVIALQNQIPKKSQQICSPFKRQPSSFSNLDEGTFQNQQKQKQKRGPSQLIQILQSQKKNVRQLYAKQLSGNMLQQDEKNRTNLKDIKESQMRVSQERNKQLSSLIQEENRSNIHAINFINQVQQNYSNNTLNSNNIQPNIQKQIKDLYGGLVDCNDNKYRLFADYQSHISNNINLQNNNINMNNSQTLVQQFVSQNKSLPQSQIQSQRSILTTIPSQTALNKVIKKSLSQIQIAKTNPQNFNRNIISVKRAQYRDHFQKSQQTSHRITTRTQNMMSTPILDQQILDDQQSQSILRNRNSLFQENNIVQNDLGTEKIDIECQQNNGQQFINSFLLETDISPSIIYHTSNQAEIIKENTIAKKIRQISNPSLRKKFQISHELLMKNFLSKSKLSHNNLKKKQDIEEDYFTSKGISTDEPKRSKQNGHQKQMSVDDLNCLRLFSDQKTQYDVEAITNTEITNMSQNMQNFNDYQENQAVVSVSMNNKFNQSLSPMKQVSQLPRTNSLNSSTQIKQYGKIQQTAESPLIIDRQNNVQNMSNRISFQKITARPSSSLIKTTNKEQIFSELKLQNQLKPGYSPSQIKMKRPTTSNFSNKNQIAAQTTQIFNNNFFSKNDPSKSQDKIKIMFKIKNNDNFTDLNSWDNSQAEDSQEFEFI